MANPSSWIPGTSIVIPEDEEPEGHWNIHCPAGRKPIDIAQLYINDEENESADMFELREDSWSESYLLSGSG
jgi:hypothetical protein